MANHIEVIDLSDDENVCEEQSQSTSQKNLLDGALLLQEATETPVSRIHSSSLTDRNASASLLNDSETVPDSFVENSAGAAEPLNESEVQILTVVTAEVTQLQSIPFHYASTSMVETTDSTLSGSSTASRSNQDGLATTIAASSPRKACPKSPSPEIVFAKVDTTPKKACPDEHEDAIFTAEYAYQEEDFAMWEPIDPLPPPHDTSDDEARQSIQENGMHSNEPDVAAAAFAGSSVETVDVELRLHQSQEKTREDDSEPGTSNALSSPAKKRRRNKEEIEQEKLLKEVNRVRREMRTAKNSKCEQYLFCYVNTNLRAMDDAIERALNDRFAERDTSDQLVFTGEDMPIKVTWKRKCIDAYVEDGKLNRIETMEPEGVYAIIIDAESFLQLTKSHGMLELVQNSTKDSGLRDAQLTVIVFGKHAVRENVLTDVLFDCYERLRCQFRFVNDARDLSYLITQMHRALAKREKKLERAASSLPVINAEKGIREGPGLVRDWWTRMLSHMHRLSEEQKRALVERYPEPFLLMRRVSEMPAGEAMHEIANIVAGNGRRVGPVVAQKLYKVLTSYDGEDVLDNED